MFTSIVFGSSGPPDCDLGDLDYCKKLGEKSQVDKQIYSVVRSSFFQLRLLAKAKSFVV